MRTAGKLTPKQSAFVDEYLIDLNATQACIRAGYSAKSADKIGHQLLGKTGVAAAIAANMAQRSKETKIDAAYVLRQAVKLHERCMQEIRPFTDNKGRQVLDDETGEPLFVFNAKGAAAGLKLIGDHIGVAAFRTQVGVGGPNGGPIQVDGAMRVEFVDAPKREE